MTTPAPASEPPMNDSQIDECRHDRDGMTPIANARPLLRMVEWQSAEIERVRGERDVLDQAFGNLVARIFRDGGHRQHQIGDITLAGEEAERVVLAERSERDALAARLAKAEEVLRFYADEATYAEGVPSEGGLDGVVPIDADRGQAARAARLAKAERVIAAK